MASLAAGTISFAPSTIYHTKAVSDFGQSFRNKPSNDLLSRSYVRSTVQSSVASTLSTPLLAGDQQPSKFLETSKTVNVIPLYECIYSDNLTPVLAYRCLVAENDHESPSFLVESMEPDLHSLTAGRYSILGANPAMEIVARKNMVTVMNHREGWRKNEFMDDPWEVPRTMAKKWSPHNLDELPQVFSGGWFGYFSGNSVQCTENRLSFSSAPIGDENLPDLHLALYDDVLIFDHVEKQIYVIHWVQLDKFPSTKVAMDVGNSRLKSLLSKVQNIVNPRLSTSPVALDAFSPSTKFEVSGTRREYYKKDALRAKKQIAAGVISQVELRQQYETRTFSEPFEVYRALRITNPSPFMAYIQVRGCILVTSGPGQSLASSEKQRTISNHSLAETDRSWSVKEHINGLTQFYRELEFTGRGPQGEGFGSISFSGHMDLAPASKTIMFPVEMGYNTLYSYKNLKNKRREWIAYLQAGATITADSDLRDLESECLREATTLARAIHLAESSFVDK